MYADGGMLAIGYVEISNWRTAIADAKQETFYGRRVGFFYSRRVGHSGGGKAYYGYKSGVGIT